MLDTVIALKIEPLFESKQQRNNSYKKLRYSDITRAQFPASSKKGHLFKSKQQLTTL